MAISISSFISYLFIILVNLSPHQVLGNFGSWQSGHAAFYNGSQRDGYAKMGGACGYGNTKNDEYGRKTAAVSRRLFRNGSSCGACYELECVNDPQWCSSGTIFITATDFSPNLQYFHISQPVQYQSRIIPISFRRVPCVRQGGIKFTIKGHSYFNHVLVTNVAGAGDVTRVSIKGSATGWQAMSRTWGQNWLTNDYLNGQSLSFQVTTSDGRTVISNNVAPANWQFGQSFEGSQF